MNFEFPLLIILVLPKIIMHIKQFEDYLVLRLRYFMKHGMYGVPKQ